MTIERRSLATVLRILSLTSTALMGLSAQAAEFTYDLHVGTYQINGSPAIYGTHGDVLLRLNNGSPSNLNQTYTYDNIVGLMATTDGSFSIAPFRPVTYSGTGSSSDVFATTDSLGRLILNQPTVNDPSLYPDQFSASASSGAYAIKWYLWTYDSVTQLPIYYFKWSDVFSSGASGKVTNIALVPEPGTWALMLAGVGVGVVGVIARRGLPLK